MEAEQARAKGLLDGRKPRQAAVALILYEQGGEPHLIFTQRTDRVGDHKGQICFPGGSQDPTDASLAGTALREAQEELGVDPASLRVVAGLRPV